MKTFDDLLDKELLNPEFREEYQHAEAELNVLEALVEARASIGMTQSQLAAASGVNQADISKIENGTRNVSIKVLTKLANAMQMDLQIRFVPKKAQ